MDFLMLLEATFPHREKDNHQEIGKGTFLAQSFLVTNMEKHDLLESFLLW